MVAFAKLKWRCHRGTKELDYFLREYLDRQYQQAGEVEQQLFVELLNCQDTQLLEWLLGDHSPASQGLDQLVKKIRGGANL